MLFRGALASMHINLAPTVLLVNPFLPEVEESDRVEIGRSVKTKIAILSCGCPFFPAQIFKTLKISA